MEKLAASGKDDYKSENLSSKKDQTHAEEARGFTEIAAKANMKQLTTRLTN